MLKKYIDINFRTLTLVSLLCAMCILFTACEKDDPIIDEPDTEEPEPEPEPDGSNFYKLIRVENVAGGEDAEDSGQSGDDTPISHNKDPFYFSLERNKRYDATYAKTSYWDMNFRGIMNTSILANNGSNSANPGFGNQARGGIAIVEKHFDEVTEIPEGLSYLTGGTGIKLDINGSLADGVGWVLYDFTGQYVRDGAYDNAHVAYALGEGITLANGTVVPPRTLIVRTANGHHAKVKMISIYKDTYTPDKWFRKTEAPFFTFEYVLIPKGETKFIIK